MIVDKLNYALAFCILNKQLLSRYTHIPSTYCFNAALITIVAYKTEQWPSLTLICCSVLMLALHYLAMSTRSWSKLKNSHGFVEKICDRCGCERITGTYVNHCSFCGVCSDFQDHHCVFISSCIGKKNYKYYFLWLASTVLLLACNLSIFVQSIHD